MSTVPCSAPRDSAKPSEYYQAFILKEQEGIAAYTGHNNAVLFGSVAPKCIRIVRAAYSCGAEPGYCREWLQQAATYHHRFMVEGKKFAFGGPGNIDDYLELYSGALLVDQGGALAQARRQCTYTETPHPVVTRLISQFLDLLEGQKVHVGDGESAESAAVKKEWGALPALFKAVSDKDVPAASSALERYLADAWAPPMEKWAKTALKAAQPEYTGKWSFFSAAVCRLLGTMPELGPKGKLYVPVDLIEP